MAKLIDDLNSFRTNQKGGHVGLISKLQIGGLTYDIKDPAVEWMASGIDFRLTGIEARLVNVEGKSWTAVTKGSSAPKFATVVEQGTDGSVTVEYGTIRGAALENSAAANKIITSLTQDVDGVVGYTVADLTADNVGFTAVGFTSTNVQGAIPEAVVKVIGVTGDAASANTIEGAKAYADAAVERLAGTDWTEQAKTVQDIIAELNGITGSAWDTLVDKLQGMSWGATGDDPGNAAPSVVEYVQHEIAKVNAQNAEGINGLDAIVFGAAGKSGATGDAATSSYAGATDTFVAIKITEDDGKITVVDVKTNDIAKASDLTTLDGEVVKSVNSVTPTNGAVVLTGSNIDLSGATGVKLDAAIVALQNDKANKNAITTSKADHWTVSYANTNNEETLIWSNENNGAGIDVYVPNGENAL